MRSDVHNFLRIGTLGKKNNNIIIMWPSPAWSWLRSISLPQKGGRLHEPSGTWCTEAAPTRRPTGDCSCCCAQTPNTSDRWISSGWGIEKFSEIILITNIESISEHENIAKWLYRFFSHFCQSVMGMPDEFTIRLTFYFIIRRWVARWFVVNQVIWITRNGSSNSNDQPALLDRRENSNSWTIIVHLLLVLWHAHHDNMCALSRRSTEEQQRAWWYVIIAYPHTHTIYL